MMVALAVQQLRWRPTASFGVATTLAMTTSTLTVFVLLIGADIATPSSGAAAGPPLAVIGGIFAEVTVVVAVLVVATTLSVLVRSQYRDLALLRTIAATPGKCDAS